MRVAAAFHSWPACWWPLNNRHPLERSNLSRAVHHLRPCGAVCCVMMFNLLNGSLCSLESLFAGLGSVMHPGALSLGCACLCSLLLFSLSILALLCAPASFVGPAQPMTKGDRRQPCHWHGLGPNPLCLVQVHSCVPQCCNATALQLLWQLNAMPFFQCFGRAILHHPSGA